MVNPKTENPADNFLLEIKKLSVQIIKQKQKHHILRDISFSVRRNETLALLGESGSGKTITALALLGLLPENMSSNIKSFSFNQKPVKEKSEYSFEHIRGRGISMIFQQPLASLNPVIKIGRQLQDVIRENQNISCRDSKHQAVSLLSEAGLDQPELIYNSYAHQLSGGMAQRVLIALALSCRPKLLIADEPATALDAGTQLQILQLLKRLQNEHKFSILLISHDVKMVSAAADNVVVLKNGEIVEKGTVSEIMNSAKDAYTKSLLELL